jgi:hypothetical protein
MKMTTSMGIVTPINKDEMKELLKETRETLAVNALKSHEANQTFGSVDLWRVRKNHRSMASMRRWSN